MKDIKILEEYLDNFNKMGGQEILKSDEIIKIIEYKEIQALENLIKEYKNLQQIEQEHKKENGALREIIKELEQNQCTHNIDNECIRKSKVKEMIDDKQTSIDNIRNNLYINQASLIEIEKLETEINALQQLLEE